MTKKVEVDDPIDEATETFRNSISTQKSTTQFTDKTPWLSISIVAAMTTCTAAQYSVYFSSMWPYLQRLDPETTEPFVGLCAAVYSLGQIVFAPVIGWWSNRIKNIRIPIVVAICLQMSGNFIYLFAQVFPPPYGKYAVAFSRFLCGMGSSNIGLLKTYAATASRKEDRARSIATCTGGLAMGLIVGPAIQLLFTPIGEEGWRITSWFALNMYTTPPLAVCLVNITAMCTMAFLFKEVYAGLLDKTASDIPKLPPADKVGLWVCYIIRSVQMFTFSSIETLSAPVAMTIFALSRTDAVALVAIVHAAMSLLELFMYVCFVGCKLDRYVNDRLVCLVGCVGIAFFYAASFPWPFLSQPMVRYNETMAAELKIMGKEPLGCNVDHLPWCEYTPQVNIYLYYILFALIMTGGFCVINITMNTIFSSIIGPRRQGTHQGFLQMMGSVGRLTGPLLVSNLYTYFGIRYAWGLEFGVCVFAALIWVFNYDHLIPIEEKMERQKVGAQEDEKVMAESLGKSSIF
ncbi:unnamed protein product [Bursaphelenchus xylophilus]|uniref:(pine wood nematode) hypothetical protein n=1 Tax=Bursaphelenchus xylophilus TaxID=6326 RepID=A0A1I7SBS6_BURXY|nr:unnamed protein product [Bursaphelenchus xylophilus]CAG9113050.1 unnamed protein product [Bursaphelenchus xylophilus]